MNFQCVGEREKNIKLMSCYEVKQKRCSQETNISQIIDYSKIFPPNKCLNAFTFFSAQSDLSIPLAPRWTEARGSYRYRFIVRAYALHCTSFVLSKRNYGVPRPAQRHFFCPLLISPSKYPNFSAPLTLNRWVYMFSDYRRRFVC